jgi:hypothetical protein
MRVLNLRQRILLLSAERLVNRPHLQLRKDMIVELHFIMGFMIGFEYVSIEEDDATHLVIDLGIVRIMFSFLKDGVDFN